MTDGRNIHRIAELLLRDDPNYVRVYRLVVHPRVYQELREQAKVPESYDNFWLHTLFICSSDALPLTHMRIELLQEYTHDQYCNIHRENVFTI